MVALVAEVNPVPEEMNWKFLVTLNSFGTWKKEKKKKFSFETIFYFQYSGAEYFIVLPQIMWILLPNHDLLGRETDLFITSGTQLISSED